MVLRPDEVERGPVDGIDGGGGRVRCQDDDTSGADVVFFKVVVEATDREACTHETY